MLMTSSFAILLDQTGACSAFLLPTGAGVRRSPNGEKSSEDYILVLNAE
jgi:hypothetical protein